MRLAAPARRALAPALIAVALGGCGPTPPQAPFPQAKKLDASTGDISTECGLTYQVTAFPGNHKQDLANLESTAMPSVRSLASVYQRNPAWMYQGETISEIVTDAVSMLKTCGLTHAAATLGRLTSHHPRS